jgi:hypothetical protein
MSEMVFVRPAPGRLVKDPYTHVALKPEGELKPHDPNWARKINVGDCLVGEAPAAEKTEAAETIVEDTQAEEKPQTKKARRQA